MRALLERGTCLECHQGWSIGTKKNGLRIGGHWFGCTIFSRKWTSNILPTRSAPALQDPELQLHCNIIFHPQQRSSWHSTQTKSIQSSVPTLLQSIPLLMNHNPQSLWPSLSWVNSQATEIISNPLHFVEHAQCYAEYVERVTILENCKCFSQLNELKSQPNAQMWVANYWIWNQYSSRSSPRYPPLLSWLALQQEQVKCTISSAPSALQGTHSDCYKVAHHASFSQVYLHQRCLPHTELPVRPPHT